MSLTKARELAVLSVLIAHPVHGYQIATAFEEGSLQFLGLKRAAVYSILSRFLKRGWVVEEEEVGESYPDRRINHVTDAGRDALADLMKQAGGISQMPLMALLLLHDSGKDIVPDARKQLAVRQQIKAKLIEDGKAHGTMASHQLAIACIAAEIDILEKVIRG